jgi:hypothetical protein
VKSFLPRNSSLFKNFTIIAFVLIGRNGFAFENRVETQLGLTADGKISDSGFRFPAIKIAADEKFIYLLMGDHPKLRRFDLQGKTAGTLDWSEEPRNFRIDQLLDYDHGLYIFDNWITSYIYFDSNGNSNTGKLDNDIVLKQPMDFSIFNGKIVGRNWGKASLENGDSPPQWLLKKIGPDLTPNLDRNPWDIPMKIDCPRKDMSHFLMRSCTENIFFGKTSVKIGPLFNSLRVKNVSIIWIDNSGTTYVLVSTIDPTRSVGSVLSTGGGARDGIRSWILGYARDGKLTCSVELEDSGVQYPNITISDDGKIYQLYGLGWGGYAVSVWQSPSLKN